MKNKHLSSRKLTKKLKTRTTLFIGNTDRKQDVTKSETKTTRTAARTVATTWEERLQNDLTC